MVNSSGTAGTLTLNVAGSYAFSGALGGNLALVKTGAGRETLSGANTYTGNTIISGGTLALSGGGSLASSSSVILAAGATLDVSAVTGGAYTLGSGATLAASGLAVNAATINGPASGTVDLGAQPIVLPAYDGTGPALTVSQGTLNLNGNAFTVNTGSPLNAGTYLLIQVASGNINVAAPCTVSGTAIGAGDGGSIVVSNGQVLLSVVEVANPTVTTLGGFSGPQPYGGLVLSASVSPSTAAGNVTFKANGITLGIAPVIGGTASLTNNLAVGVYTNQALFNDPSVVYSPSSSAYSYLTVTQRVVTVSGGKSYDGKAVIPSTSLTIADNFDGANLTLSGAAVLSGRNAGSETVVASTVTAPVRQQTAFATTGNQPLLSRTPIAYSATLSNVPGNGNTLVAVIATRGASANQVASITQSGAIWTRAVQAVNANGNGTTTEILVCAGGAERGDGGDDHQ